MNKNNKTILLQEAEFLKHNSPKYYQAVWYISKLDHVIMFLEIGDMYMLKKSWILINRGRFNEDITKLVTSQLLTAFQCLHDRSIIHRDIKLENETAGCANMRCKAHRFRLWIPRDSWVGRKRLIHIVISLDGLEKTTVIGYFF